MNRRGIIEMLGSPVVLNGVVDRIDHDDKWGEELDQGIGRHERVVLAPKVKPHGHENQIQNNLAYNNSQNE